MHQLKETTIDGVKFVLIPETLHDQLALYVLIKEMTDPTARQLASAWIEFDPEVFNVE